ncbi:unnamed protein product [Eruca vesicaria subsp. sativa]|uniref:CCT domain-containing protein n=1 Tax=Eruca vesicaria subsp. sativa TaxID=29727 RepID=A0ABC8JH97_ERUVS|nr:unnamed protein product [Eruca vesicaria subsp. sativa]
MCSLTSPAGEVKQSTRKSKRIKKRKQMESTSMNTSPSTSRKQIRTKTKRPKFLSLKLELSTSHESPKATKSNKKKKKKQKQKPSKQSKTKETDTKPFKDKKRAETIGCEKEEEQYENTVAAYLFSSATDSSMSSIQDLLPSSSTHHVERNLSPYDSHHHEHHGGSSSSSSLLKTAMRKGASKEEETTEERWVSYSEVVEEVMSRSGTPRPDGKDGRPSSLALKLDYEQIMEAWSDKGTLYVDGEPPQTVPDLHASADVFTGGGEAGSLWTVPEMETTERLWRGHREASLLRYKEKRQNRLFSKRIRYEVRKLNAEKRPRVKGRFVKRDD